MPFRRLQLASLLQFSLFTVTFTQRLGIYTIYSRSLNANPAMLQDAFPRNVQPNCLLRQPARKIPPYHHTPDLKVRLLKAASRHVFGGTTFIRLV